MKRVVIIRGSFAGKECICGVVVAVAPEKMEIREILLEGLRQQMYSRIGDRWSEEISENVILLVIP